MILSRASAALTTTHLVTGNLEIFCGDAHEMNGMNAQGQQEKAPNFWKDTASGGGSALNKLPGRVMKQNSYALGTGSKPSTPTKQAQHRRNNSTSFELFTASCEDAWDSHIDDCDGSAEDLAAGGRTASSSSRGPGAARRSSSATRTGAAPRTAKSAPGTANSLRGELLGNRGRPENVLGSAAAVAADPKLAKFKKLLFEDDVTDLNQVRSMAWAGIPGEVRPVTWKLLLGYLPVMREKRVQALERKVSSCDLVAICL